MGGERREEGHRRRGEEGGVRVPREHGRLLRHLLHEQRLLQKLLLLHAGDDRPPSVIRVWSGDQLQPTTAPVPTTERKRKTERKKEKKMK
jgi:hypothetical protein